MEDKNPHLRFAALLAPKSGFSQRQLIDYLQLEPCAILRQLMTQRLGKVSNDPSDDSLKEISGLLTSVSEMVYFIEAKVGNGPLPSILREQMTIVQRLVAGLAGDWPEERAYEIGPERNSIACELVAALARGSVSHRSDGLLRAFGSDLEEGAKLELESISLQQIRQALREVSPLDDGGLGTFDKLQKLDTVDQLYLFFRQLQFMRERGLLSKRKTIDPDPGKPEILNSARLPNKNPGRNRQGIRPT